MKFPNGIPISRNKEDRRDTLPLYEMFGISRERADFVKKICKIAIINAEEKDHIEVDRAFFEIASKCETLNEFALAMYSLGVVTTRQQGGSMGGIGPMIIMGGMRNMGGETGSSETGEEPSIEELIRRSKKINGGKRKDENEDYL